MSNESFQKFVTENPRTGDWIEATVYFAEGGQTIGDRAGKYR